MAKSKALNGPRWETPASGRKAKGSYGPAIEKWAKASIGITLDPWQSFVLNQALRHDAKGDLLFRTVLIGTPRQQGKSSIVRALAGWLLTEGRDVGPFASWTEALFAAADAKQARIPYSLVWNDLGSDEALRARLAKFTEYRGMKGGKLMLDTVTGQAGAVRGHSAGLILYDEIQEQTSFDFTQALKPIQSAQRSPLLFATGTAGHIDSIVLKGMYDRLRAQVEGADDPTFYGAWWEATEANGTLDWNAVAEANPAFPHRVTKATVEEEFKSLPYAAFRQERLNLHALVKASGAFNEAAWARVHLDSPLEGVNGPFCLGVDIDPGWNHATICVAGIRPDGRVGVEVYRSLDSEDGKPLNAQRVTDEIMEFWKKWNHLGIQAIAYDFQSAGDPAFMRHASETGLPYDRLGVPQIMSASMDVSEMVLSGRLGVSNSPLIESQITNVAKRKIGQEGGFRFSRAASNGPIDAVMAMAFAAHSAAYQPSMPTII